MKKYLLFLGVMVLMVSRLYSQNGFYAKSYIGYNLAFGNMKTENVTFINNYYASINKNVLLGTGINGTISIGYDFKNNLTFELISSYFIGNKNKTSFDISTYSLGNFSVTQEQQLKMLQITPVFIISTAKHIITPYIKFGFVFGLPTIIREETINQNNEQSILKMYGGIVYGINTGLGATYSITDKLQIFAEINYINMTVSPKKGIYTKYTVNGNDFLPNIPQMLKDFYYDDNAGIPDVIANTNKSFNNVKPYFLYNSLGLNIGIKFNFINLAKNNTDENR